MAIKHLSLHPDYQKFTVLTYIRGHNGQFSDQGWDLLNNKPSGSINDGEFLD
jgi:hypothetical protein